MPELSSRQVSILWRSNSNPQIMYIVGDCRESRKLSDEATSHPKLSTLRITRGFKKGNHPVLVQRVYGTESDHRLSSNQSSGDDAGRIIGGPCHQPAVSQKLQHTEKM